VIRSDRHWQGEALARRLDGSQFEQSISMTELPDGKIVHVSRDVSALKELERGRRILREEIELAQRQEVINLLAAGLTHDFSNLLAVISHLTDPDSAVAFEKIDTRAEIHRATRQMIDLLEPLRGYVKGAAVEKDADLVDIVRNAAELTALGAPRALSVENDLPDHALKAMVDPVRLTQVLMNLGLNARDVIGHEEGTIRFALSRDSAALADLPLELGQVPAAPFVHIIVSDTGSGIPNDIRQRIWEPYFTTKGDKGTGLGLALIAAIIRDVGGGIALETESGQGTTFHIFWPLNYLETGADVDEATAS
jgi:signal transduction histidine kinase